MVHRALRLRCPACGGGPVFLSWFRLASELLFASVAGAVAVATWPTPPWTLMTVGGVALMILTPLVFLPFSKVLFLAFDLFFRPPVESDFAAPSEPAASRRA